MNNKFGLSERTINELLKYFQRKTEIEKVVVYGSRAKNTYKTGSDIDFAIWTDQHNKIPEILSELDELPTPYSFDVTDYKMLKNENIKTDIDNDGILFYSNETN